MWRVIFLASLLAACAQNSTQQEQQALVDRSTLAVQEQMTSGDRPQDAQDLLKRARAVLVCPRIFRASFIVGGEGGNCLLVGRDGSGSWSSPAFYGMGGGSLGLQAGIQDAGVMVLIMNDRALNATLNSQFRFGGDANLTFASLGAGIGGGTTAAAGADFVTLVRSRGLFAGLSLQGSLISFQPEAVRSYYGREASGRQVVIDMAVHNPNADPLRAVLMRYGTRG